VLDVEGGADGRARIWVTETTVGGAGVVQAFADAFSEEPRALFRAIEAALAPTDLEIAADGLENYLVLASAHQDVSDAAEFLRGSLGHEERELRRHALRDRLAAHGLDVPRALAVSLDARVFRPGTGPDFERALLNIVKWWDKLESKLGVTIGLREMCYAASSDVAIRAAVRALLRDAAPSVPDTSVDLVQVLTSLLWPRGIEIRQRALQSYNRFRRPRLTDPALVRFLLLQERVPEVSAEDPHWRIALGGALSVHGTARLWAAAESTAKFRAALVESLVLPVEVGYLRFFPTIERLDRDGARLVATLSLRECV
jgi:hypothetical protein